MKKLLVIALSLGITGMVAIAADGEKKERPAPRGKALEKYDKNSDGKLDESEREAMRKDRQAEAIKKYDKNGDGKLDESERQAAQADRRKAADGAKPQPKKDK